MSYQYQTEPFPHQRQLFEETRDREAWGILWEQGCGKTKPALDTAAHLFETGKIDALLVVAPDGVHRNWLTDEIPRHLPERVLKRSRLFAYKSGSAGAQWHQREVEALLKWVGLAVLCISYNAFMTEKGKRYVWRFLKRRRCLYVLDESHFIKSPGAKRTISVVASGKYAPYRRVLTGTPVTQGPFDLYSQVKFLNPGFWAHQGLGSFGAYKQFFGVWRTAAEVLRTEGYDPGYDQLLGYKNVEMLQKFLASISHRVTKESAGLNLPPKLYSKRYFSLSPEQARVYRDLVSEYMAELESGDVVEADLAIVRLLRLQQVACGYVACEAEEPVQPIGKVNPRLDLAREVCDGLSHQAIVWARFKADVARLSDALGKNAVAYSGAQSGDERALAKEAFTRGDVQFLVSNPAVGGTGLTFINAKTHVYYSNSFNLSHRLQSEDRSHRIGQDVSVEYIDLIAEDTVDGKILDALSRKLDVASSITGDALREWLK